MIPGRSTTRLFAALVWLSLAAPPLAAQYYDDPGLGSKPVAQHPQDYKPLGIRAGTFMLHPGVQLAAQWTDNAFYQERDGRSDTIYHVRPYLNAQSTWSKHSLNVRLAADLAYYDTYSFRDYDDYFFTVNGRIDVKNRSYASYGASYMNLHEDLNSRDSEQGYEPTRYDVYGLNLGYDHVFNRLALGGMLNWDRFDYDNAVGFFGQEINNQDRDRDGYSWMLRAGYQFQTDMQAFVSYTGYKVEYDEQYDRYGYDRSGDGYTVSAGLALTFTGKLQGDIFATYNDRSYDSPILPNTGGWALGAGLQWNPTYLTSVYGRIASSVEETTNPFSSGYLRTLYSLRVDHELLRFLQINGFVSYSDNDYQLIPGAPADARAKDKIFRAGVGLSWFINRWLYLNASYDYEQLRTNVPDDGYDVNYVWLQASFEY